MINDCAEWFDAGGQGCFAIGFKKELGVCQTRSDHALIALDDRDRLISRHIADDQKLMGELACVRVKQGKIFLIQTHRQNQTLLRYGQKPFFEGTHINSGRLNECGDFIEQSRDFLILTERGAEMPRLCVE